jgi:hypothetical protein
LLPSILTNPSSPCRKRNYQTKPLKKTALQTNLWVNVEQLTVFPLSTPPTQKGGVDRGNTVSMLQKSYIIQGHQGQILNYFRAKNEFSSGIVEGFNNKAKLTIRKSYGFRSDK